MTQRAISVLLNAITGPYEAAMGRASMKTSQFGTVAQGTQRQAAGLGHSFGGLSKKLLAGGGIAFALKEGAQLLMEYEDALVGVGKTTGLTGAELSVLGDDLTDMAKNIKGSAEDMLGIAQSAAQLGVSNDNIAEFTEVIANMASATDLTVDSAATQMARLSNILGRPIDEVEALGSTIVALGNNMATTEPEIVTLAMRLGAAGRLAGFADAEVVGLAAAMSELGIEAEAGGTAMSRVLNEITKAVGLGSDKLDTFASTAQMSVDKFVEAWSDDPAAALEGFLSGLSQLSESERFRVMENLGLDAARLTDVLIRTSSGAEGLADAFSLANGAMEDNTALAEEAAAANATASAAWDNLIDTLKDFGRATAGGEEGAGLLATTLNGLSEAVESLNEVLFENQSFRGLNDDMTEATTTLGRLDQAWMDFIDPFAAALMGDVGAFSETWMGTAEAAEYAASAFSETNTILGLTEGVGRSAAGGMDAAAAAALGLSGSADEVTLSLREQAEQLLAMSDPAFGFLKAQEAVKEAQEAQKDAIEEHGRSSGEAEDAAVALFEALRHQAVAAHDAGVAFRGAEAELRNMERTGQISAETARQLRDVLDDASREAANLEAMSPLGLAVDFDLSGLDEFERRMSEVMGRRYETSVAVNTYTPTNDAVAGVPASARAAGGPVYPGSMYLVGEQGPELFSPNTAGRIMPAGQTAQMMGGGSSSTFAPTIQVTQAGSDPYADANFFLKHLAAAAS